MRFTVDAVAYLLPTVADDEELYRPSHRVDDLVYTEGRHVEHHVAIDDALEVLQHKIAARDDDDIAEQDDASQRDVTILVHDGGNDVGAARRTVGCQSQSYAAAAEHGADDGCHERLVGQQTCMIELTEQRQSHREDGDAIDGFYAEAPSQNLQGKEQQEGVDDEIRQVDRNLQSPEQERRHTGNTACRDVVGQQEHGPSYTVAHHADGQQQVVANLLPNSCFRRFLYHSIIFGDKVTKKNRNFL